MKKMWLKKNIIIGLICSTLFLFATCESNDRFYRPDLPEKLCCVGIIDVDDTLNYEFSIRDIKDIRNSTRYLTFEKSYQSEYSYGTVDSLDEFTFEISTDNSNVFTFHGSAEIKSPLKFELPDSLKFISGKNYLLHARAANIPKISGHCTVPDPPVGFNLISVKEERVFNHISTPCTVKDTASSVLFEISFPNNHDKDNYYMILLIVNGMFSDIIPYSGPLDFFIRETNTPGFFAEIFGLNTLNWECVRDLSGAYLSGTYSPQTHGYFIDGSKISGIHCRIKLSIQYNDGFSPLIHLDQVRIKLLSIPKDFYMFEKNLYNYIKIKEDPFAEPVFLYGNIKGGNGVFAICRSVNLDIIL